MWRPFGKEENDERFAERLNDSIEAMSDRRVLLRFLFVGAVLNVLIWLCVIIFPGDVREAFSRVNEASDKLSKVILALVFGLGMWVTYSLFRLKFPDIEEQRLDAEVMGSFAYQAHSSKRWMIWLFSVVGGVLNLLLLIIAATSLS